MIEAIKWIYEFRFLILRIAMGSICILPKYFLDLEPHNCRSYVYSSVLMVVEFEFSVVIGCSLYCTAHEHPHQSLCIVAAVAISLDQMNFNIFENEQVVTVTLTLNDTYREDIVVNVAVGELLGGCTRGLYILC